MIFVIVNLFNKNQKNYQKNQHFNYFPIFKIFDQKSELIFEENKIQILGRRKSEEIKKFLIHFLSDFLQFNNFEIQEKN